MYRNQFQLLLAIAAILASCLNLASSDNITCYQCDSNASPECITNPTSQKTVSCTTGCVTYQATPKNSLIRDCSENIPPSVLSSQKCTTDKCNTNLVCKECLGENNCAIPSALPTSLEVCSSEQTACITLLNSNSTVSRSCGVATSCNAPDCSSCTTGICNAEIYPTDRLQCYKCSDANCNTVASTMLAPCGLNNATCYTIGTSDATMQRGCTSDTDAKCTANTTDANCLLCGEKECNNLTFNRDGGTCISCANCSGKEEASQGEACANSNYTQSQGCYSQIVGDATNRGCLNTLVGTCTSENRCTSCNTTNCNLAPTFTCLRCDSYTNSNCTEGNVVGIPCANQNDTQCFSGKWGDLVVRDCLEEASELMNYQCYHDLYNCKVCDKANCNNNSFSGAGFLQVSLTLMMISMGFLFIRFL